MKFLIAGAGAIGGYLGARMAQAGQDVTLFARGPHLRAMQERGRSVAMSARVSHAQDTTSLFSRAARISKRCSAMG